MTIVTCPAIRCQYNGYGECHLGSVANVLQSGAVTQADCPYFDAAPVAETGPSGMHRPDGVGGV